MGGSSSKEKGGKRTVPCPLFYNHMPNARVVPFTTLPLRSADGGVTGPRGGCGARVQALRSATAEVIEDAEMRKGKSKGSKRIDAAEVPFASVIPSSLSSCFLINYLVDEMGRLVPLVEDSEAAESVRGGEVVGVATLDPAEVQRAAHPTKKGFNFSSTVSPRDLSGGGDAGGPAPNGEESGELRERANDGAAANPLAADAASGRYPTHEPNVSPRQRPRVPQPSKSANGAVVGDRSFAVSANGHRGGGSEADRSTGANPLSPATTVATVDVSNRGGLSPTTTGTFAASPLSNLENEFVMPLSIPDIHRHPSTTDSEEDLFSLASSVRSVLIKDGRFRRTAEGEANGTPGPPRLVRNRSTSRVARIHVPQRLRWAILNDSLTHEAHVTFSFCYMRNPTAQTPVVRRELAFQNVDASAVPPLPSAEALPDGDLMIYCKPTQFVTTEVSAKALKDFISNSPTSNRIFVQIRTATVADFITLLPPSIDSAQERQIQELKDRGDAGLAVVQVFAVLAPGTTLYFAEGETMAYCIDSLMVPFDVTKSICVVGPLLTREAAQASLLATSAYVSSTKGYRTTYRYDVSVLSQKLAAERETSPPPLVLPHAGHSRLSEFMTNVPRCGSDLAFSTPKSDAELGCDYVESSTVAASPVRGTATVVRSFCTPPLQSSPRGKDGEGATDAKSPQAATAAIMRPKKDGTLPEAGRAVDKPGKSTEKIKSMDRGAKVAENGGSGNVAKVTRGEEAETLAVKRKRKIEAKLARKQSGGGSSQASPVSNAPEGRRATMSPQQKTEEKPMAASKKGDDRSYGKGTVNAFLRNTGTSVSPKNDNIGGQVVMSKRYGSSPQSTQHIVSEGVPRAKTAPASPTLHQTWPLKGGDQFAMSPISNSISEVELDTISGLDGRTSAMFASTTNGSPSYRPSRNGASMSPPGFRQTSSISTTNLSISF